MGAGVTTFLYAFLTGFFPYTTGAHGLAGSAIGLLLFLGRRDRVGALDECGLDLGVGLCRGGRAELVGCSLLLRLGLALLGDVLADLGHLGVLLHLGGRLDVLRRDLGGFADRDGLVGHARRRLDALGRDLGGLAHRNRLGALCGGRALNGGHALLPARLDGARGDHGGIGRLGSGTLRRRTADQGIGQIRSARHRRNLLAGARAHVDARAGAGRFLAECRHQAGWVHATGSRRRGARRGSPLGGQVAERDFTTRLRPLRHIFEAAAERRLGRAPFGRWGVPAALRVHQSLHDSGTDEVVDRRARVDGGGRQRFCERCACACPGANPAVDQVAFRRAGRRQFLEQFLADAGVLAQFARLAARHAALLAARLLRHDALERRGSEVAIRMPSHQRFQHLADRVAAARIRQRGNVSVGGHVG